MASRLLAFATSRVIYNEMGRTSGRGRTGVAGGRVREQGGKDDFQLNLKRTTET